MNLAAWLKTNKKTQGWLAAKLKCDQGRISKLVNRKVMPTIATMVAVEKATSGGVGVLEWAKPAQCSGTKCAVPRRKR